MGIRILVDKNLAEMIMQRRADPLECPVCTARRGRPAYFEPDILAWHHCPRCDGHGFASVHGAYCTGCANILRFGAASPTPAQVEDVQKLRRLGKG